VYRPFKNSPHECGATKALDIPADESPPQRTTCAASTTTVPTQPSHLSPIQINGPLALNDPDITINACFYCGILDFHITIKRKCTSMLTRGCLHIAQCLSPGGPHCPGYAALHVLQGVRPSAILPEPFTV
jgi:hypothetical protein